MYRLVRLGECVHVFDSENIRFVKSSAVNVELALGFAGRNLTRKQMIGEVQWLLCADPRCRFKCCEEGGHWVARNTRSEK